MKKLLFLTFFFSFILFSCNYDSDCFTPPEPIVMEFVNSKGENLIQNGSLTKEHFHFLQIAGDTKIGTNFEINHENRVILNKLGWIVGSTTYEAFVNVSKLSRKCGGNKIDNVSFKDIEALSQNGIYQIVVE
ncbi:MAG TPA: hypothetical protein DEQ26_15170 [Flavobacteriaceae bacterium]|nr:hypothetical protein [Flavobacteriaceae bacterium]